MRHALHLRCPATAGGDSWNAVAPSAGMPLAVSVWRLCLLWTHVRARQTHVAERRSARWQSKPGVGSRCRRYAGHRGGCTPDRKGRGPRTPLPLGVSLPVPPRVCSRTSCCSTLGPLLRPLLYYTNPSKSRFILCEKRTHTAEKVGSSRSGSVLWRVCV